MGPDFAANHRAGAKHQAADELSRLRRNGTDDKDINVEIPVLPIQQQSGKEINYLTVAKTMKIRKSTLSHV